MFEQGPGAIASRLSACSCGEGKHRDLAVGPSGISPPAVQADDYLEDWLGPPNKQVP